MAAYQEKKAELEALGATVYGASVDSLERAKEVGARGLTYPVAYGVTREQCDLFGGWWNERRGSIEPSEFMVERGGLVLGSMYASGPVGRMAAEEVLTYLSGVERRRLSAAPGR